MSGAKQFNVGDTVRIRGTAGLVGTVTYRVGRKYSVSYSFRGTYFTSIYEASEMEHVAATARGESGGEGSNG